MTQDFSIRLKSGLFEGARYYKDKIKKDFEVRLLYNPNIMAENQWIKNYPEGIDWKAELSGAPLYRLLDESAKRFPDNILINFLGKKYSFAQIENMVNRAAEGFRKLGVKKGVKVGLFLPNTPHFIISYYAILKAGGTVVNYSPLYALPELEHQLKDSETEIMVTLNLEVLYPKIEELLERGGLKKIVIGTMSEVLSFPKNILFPLLKSKEIAEVKDDEKHISWSQLLDNDSISCLEHIDPTEDIAVLQYTGGTTGVPKGAMLTHDNLYINAQQCGLWFADLEDGVEKMMGVLPFFHVFAMTTVMNFSVLKGAEIIMLPRFELEKTIKAIDKNKPTLMPGVPTMFTAINNFKDIDKYDLSSVKSCISGGAGLPVKVKSRFEEMTGCKLIEGYGLTETSPVACANPFFGMNKAGSIGVPFPQTIIEIEDIENRGKFLPVGEKGEICITGPQVMKGYWQNESATKEDMDESGRFRTGDIGYIDADGYVFIVDRLKEMIIAGGFNIYPRNVEEAIYTHEAVLEVAVIGIKDEYLGQAIKAFVALKPDAELGEEELQDFLRDKIGKHEIPDFVEFRDELPKTMIGKISKKDLA